jgi:hypothetical protein
MRKRDASDRFLVESNRRFEGQVVEVGAGQIDRTDVGVQTLGDEVYYVG